MILPRKKPFSVILAVKIKRILFARKLRKEGVPEEEIKKRLDAELSIDDFPILS